jgi:hypothetical protein
MQNVVMPSVIMLSVIRTSVLASSNLHLPHSQNYFDIFISRNIHLLVAFLGANVINVLWP